MTEVVVSMVAGVIMALMVAEGGMAAERLATKYSVTGWISDERLVDERLADDRLVIVERWSDE